VLEDLVDVDARQPAEFVDYKAENSPIVREDGEVFGLEVCESSDEPGISLLDGVEGLVVPPFVQLPVAGQDGLDGHVDYLVLGRFPQGLCQQTGVVQHLVGVAAHVLEMQGKLVPQLQLQGGQHPVLFPQNVRNLGNFLVGFEVGRQVGDRQEDLGRLLVVPVRGEDLEVIEGGNQIRELPGDQT
jgi:hypothetical protein